jgi:hypothetical protein
MIELLADLVLARNWIWIAVTMAACLIVKWRVGLFPAVVIGVVSAGTLFVSLYGIYAYTDIVYCGSERFYPDGTHLCVPGFSTYESLLASHREYGQNTLWWAVAVFALALAALVGFRVWTARRRAGRRGW